MYTCIGLPKAEPNEPFTFGPVSFVPLEQFLAGPGEHFSESERESLKGLNWIVGVDSGPQTLSHEERKRLIDSACDLLRTLLPLGWTQCFGWTDPYRHRRYRSVVFCDQQANRR